MLISDMHHAELEQARTVRQPPNPKKKTPRKPSHQIKTFYARIGIPKTLVALPHSAS